MTSFSSRVFMLLVVGIVAACGPQAQQSAKVESTPEQAQKAPPPASQPPAPTPTPQPAPEPAGTTPSAPAAPPTAAQPAAPAPATQEAPAKAPAETPQVLVISVGRANMRERPDTKARILRVLTKGTKLVVVSKGNQWFRVRLSGGGEGWVAESVVVPARD